MSNPLDQKQMLKQMAEVKSGPSSPNAIFLASAPGINVLPIVDTRKIGPR